MVDLNTVKRAVVHNLQHYLINPVVRRAPVTMIETVGRQSGLPRRTVVGGERDGSTFWLVSEHGRHSDYVKNITAHPGVRMRIGGQWHTGTARLLPDDDPIARLRAQGSYNSRAVRLLGTDLLTIRIDLD